MSIRVNDDSGLLFALRQSQISQSEIGKRLAGVASGLRIRSAADDASGLAVAETLSSQSRGLSAAGRNIQDFSSLAQTAEAGLSGIQDMAKQIGELSVQASNGTLTDDDRQAIQEEVTQLKQEIDRQASSTQFNGRPLLNGTFSSSVQSGPNAGDVIQLSLDAADTVSLGLSGVDVTTQNGAQSAISASQGATNSIATERAAIGGVLNRLQRAYDFAGIANENVIAAESRIRDTDTALELAGLIAAQIRERTGLFGVAQGNIDRQNAARLLGG